MTYKEFSHGSKDLDYHKDDFTINDKELTWRKKHIAWRRQKVFTLLVQGVTSTYDLAHALSISQSTASRDCRYLREEATRELQTHLRGRLPWQYKICSEGISQVLRYAWSMILEDNGKANKIATLSLIASCYKDLLEISTNAGVVTEALNQVERMKDQILGLYSPKEATNDRSISQ